MDQNYTQIDEGHRAVLRALIDAGVDLSARDQKGRTAFVIAGTRKNLEILEVLLTARVAMREKDRIVLAVLAVALVLSLFFFVPWRVGPMQELAWGPVYRPPVEYSRTYAHDLAATRYQYADAKIAKDLLLLQIGAIAAVGALVWRRSKRP